MSTATETRDFDDDYDDAAYDNRDEYDEEDEIENALLECGQWPGGGGCTLAGTEHCDWECPYSDIDLFSAEAE